MTILILVAGSGRRLNPYMADGPKCATDIGSSTPSQRHLGTSTGPEIQTWAATLFWLGRSMHGMWACCVSGIAGVGLFRESTGNMRKVNRVWIDTHPVDQTHTTDLLMAVILVAHTVIVDGRWLEIDSPGDYILAIDLTFRADGV
jgi:hypothetical protein